MPAGVYKLVDWHPDILVTLAVPCGKPEGAAYIEMETADSEIGDSEGEESWEQNLRPHVN